MLSQSLSHEWIESGNIKQMRSKLKSEQLWAYPILGTSDGQLQELKETKPIIIYNKTI